MKYITIPVAGLTRAVMLRHYHQEPIRLAQTDIRRRQMMHVGSKSKHLQRKQYVLNATITLRVSQQEYDHLAAHAAEVGYYFYAQDKHDMFTYVWARVHANLPALHALKDYYQVMRIEEDDHSLETAERQWKRWRKEKEKERIYFTPKFVPQNICVLFTVDQAEELADRLARMIDEGVVVVDPRLKDAARLWALHELTHLTQLDIEKMTNRAQSNVSISIRRFRSLIEYSVPLQRWLGYLVRTTVARPVPSVAS